jgi:hypothetical protein
MSAPEFAGGLKARVQLLRRDPARDDLGGTSGAWVPGASLWLALTPLGPGKADGGDLPAGPTRWRGVLRSGVALAVGDRLAGPALTVAILSIEADPASPDRLTLLLETVP